MAAREKAARAAGEGYGEHDDNDAGLRAMVGDPSRTMPLMLALLPLVLVIGINALFTYGIFPGMDWAFLKQRFPTMDATRQTGMWALIIALVVSIIVLLLVSIGRWANLQQSINKGVLGSMLPIFNTASEVGYGAVIASLADFAIIRDAVLNVSSNPLISEAVAMERAGRHHRLVVGRFVDCAADAGRRLLADGQRGRHQPRFAAPRGGDVGRRVRLAAALRRHHHPAVDLQADPQAVVPEHRGDDHRDSAHRAERGDSAGHDVWVVLNRFERKSRKDGATARKKILRSFLRLLRNLCALCVQREEAVHCR